MKYKILLNQPYRGKEEFYCESFTIQESTDPEYDIIVFQETGKTKSTPHAIYADHIDTILKIDEKVVFDREPYIFLRRAHQWGNPHKKYQWWNDLVYLIKSTL